MNDSVYSLYLINCDAHILYTGIAINPSERLEQHRSKKPPGAKFTRRFKQLELVYQVVVGNRSEAQNLEYHIKKLSKQKKLILIEQQPTLTELKSFLACVT